MNIVITGASKGIGFAIAEKFAGDGGHHTLFICARNNSELHAASKQITNRFPTTTVHHRVCDVGVKEQVLAFAEWIAGFNQPTNVLINNAGDFIGGNVHDAPDDAFEAMMAINVYSAYYLTKELLPAMMKRNAGHIFNMCSIASLRAYNVGSAYSISKFALAGFSKNLREEMKPYNIKVTAVYPGATYTDSWVSSGLPAEQFLKVKDVADIIYAAAMLSPQACVEEIVLRPVQGDIT